jgi:hypothetical protein
VETFTAADLMKMTLPEPRWAVNGVLPEGLSILAGKPKLGKSWLALGFALAVASGGTALGSVAVEKGDVLYLALEDTRRRLQSRLNKLLGAQHARPPERLTLAVEWPRMGEGGLEAVGAWLERHKEARLVVVDTWVKFRPKKLVKTDDYEWDYQHGGELKKVADRERLATWPLHHCRKLGAADPLEEVSGSVGLTGVADAVLVMRRERGRHDAALFVMGRDVEEQELALSWSGQFCTWSLLGDAQEYRISKERSEVVSVVRRAGRPVRAGEVAAALGKSQPTVRKLLWSMFNDGQLACPSEGLYCLSGNGSHSGNGGNGGNGGNARVTGALEGGNAPGNAPDEPHYRFPD